MSRKLQNSGVGSMQNERKLWEASRRYMKGEISGEELHEVEKPFHEDFKRAMLVLSEQELARHSLWGRFKRWIRRIKT
jgi:hypothetical protein